MGIYLTNVQTTRVFTNESTPPASVLPDYLKSRSEPVHAGVVNIGATESAPVGGWGAASSAIATTPIFES